MLQLGSLLTDWFSSDTSWIVFVLGCLLGWIVGLVWWWYFTGRRPAVAERTDPEVQRLVGRLASVETSLTSQTGELHRLQAELTASSGRDDSELTDLTSARDDALARLADLEGELSAMPSVAALDAPAAREDDGSADAIAGLERQLAASREIAADAVQAHQGCDARMERVTRESDEIARTKDREIERLRAQVDAARDAPSAEHAAALAALVGERDNVQTLLSNSERELAGRTGELDGARARIESLTAERDAVHGELAELRSAAGRHAAMEAELATLRRERDEARKQARRQLLDLQNEFEESTRHAAEDLARLRDERKQFQTQLRLAGSEVERMRDEAQRGDASDAEAERLRARLSSVEGKYTADVRERDGKIDQLMARVNALQDEMRNPPKQKRPARDELQRIFGIGPVLERKLHGMGYLRFEDIAAWQRADVERVADALGSFPDRIERDAWVAQAGRLAAEMQREYED